MPRSDHVHPIVVSWAGIGRSVEEKGLAGLGQRPLKSRNESEWKATTALCISQHKVIHSFCPENSVETLPAEQTMNIHSGVTGHGGGKHPHGLVGKSPSWASETEVPAPSPQCIGLLCILEQTLHKADLITSAHLGCIHTASFHCNVAMAGIKSSMYGFSWKPWQVSCRYPIRDFM